MIANFDVFISISKCTITYISASFGHLIKKCVVLNHLDLELLQFFLSKQFILTCAQKKSLSVLRTLQLFFFFFFVIIQSPPQ